MGKSGDGLFVNTDLRHRLLFGVCALLGAGLAAGPAWSETLEAEMESALETNPSLARERARLDAIRQAEPIAWSELLPQVSVDGNLVANDSSPDQTPAITFAGGLPANPTPAQIAARRRSTEFVREQDEYWIATLRVSTMLFGSGRVWASTRQARAQVASAVALYQQAVQEFAVDLSRAYGEVRFAREALSAQEESLANLEEQARFARANLREGFLTRTDVAQAEARVAQAHADLARARSRVVQTSEAYMSLTGHPPGALTPPEHVAGLPTDLEVALEAAEEHPQLVAAAANIRAADAAVSLAEANGRMRVFLESANSRFDVAGPTNRFVAGVTPTSPAREQDYKEQSDDTVNVRVSIPLFSGGATRARARQERDLRAAARYELADTQRTVRAAVASALSDLDAARARLEASQARLEAAELASRGVRREQQFGQRSMIDVLNQEQERLGARVALAEAERDAMVAERVYAAAIGQIAPLLGLDATPEPRRGLIGAITQPFQDGDAADVGERQILVDPVGPRRTLVVHPTEAEDAAPPPAPADNAPSAPAEAAEAPAPPPASAPTAPEPATETAAKPRRGLWGAFLHLFGWGDGESH